MDFLLKLERVMSTLPVIDKQSVEFALLQLQPVLQDVQAYILAPQGLEYGRNVLFKNEKVEVLLVFLPHFAKTLVHDHGVSSGWIYVVEGSVLNLIYSKYKKEVNYEKNEFYKNGEIFSVKGDTTHAMYNPTYTSTVTLHVYSPPLGTGQVYKPHE